VDSAKIGGLGIHITRELMNEVSYERKGRLNRLILKKSIPADEDPTP
jgi:anti-sigma regulatory factor (Ser/Thr protein kinase)